MKRSGRCKRCGATIRPHARNMSVAAASRKHYWRHHPEVMLAGVAKRRWKQESSKKKAVRR